MDLKDRARVLLYADDPGAVNFLFPVYAELSERDIVIRFVVDSSLSDYISHRGMSGELRASKNPTDFLKDIDLLVVGTSEDRNCFGLKLVEAARTMSVKSIGVVDMEVNASGRFQGLSESPIEYLPDALIVPDSDSVESYVSIGVEREKIKVFGHPHFDQVRKRRDQFNAFSRTMMRQKSFPDAPTDRPIWVFLAEGVDQLRPSESYKSPEYTMVGRADSEFRAEIVLQEIIDASKDIEYRPWIVLRLHPKNLVSEFTSVIGDIDQVSSEGDPLPMVWAADHVFGMTTMLLMEAYLLGRPHTSVLPRKCEASWLPTIKLGLTRAVFDRPELKSRLNAIHRGVEAPTDKLPVGASKDIAQFILGQLDIQVSIENGE